jgi:hypothetical protein
LALGGAGLSFYSGRSLKPDGTAAIIREGTGGAIPQDELIGDEWIGAYNVKFLGMTSDGRANWSCTLVFGVPGGKLQTWQMTKGFPAGPTTGKYPTREQVYADFYRNALYQTNYYRVWNPACNEYAANRTDANFAAYVAAMQKWGEFVNKHPWPRY